MGLSSNPTRKKQNEIGRAMKEITSQNNFEVLSNPEEQALPMIEEGEVQQSQDLIREENKDSTEHDLGSPIGGSISPTYAEMEKKKPMDNSGSSEEESLERSSKKGHKHIQKVREEEDEHLKMQGSQATIEMSIGRNTRARPIKGGPPPSVTNK